MRFVCESSVFVSWTCSFRRCWARAFYAFYIFVCTVVCCTCLHMHITDKCAVWMWVVSSAYALNFNSVLIWRNTRSPSMGLGPRMDGTQMCTWWRFRTVFGTRVHFGAVSSCALSPGFFMCDIYCEALRSAYIHLSESLSCFSVCVCVCALFSMRVCAHYFYDACPIRIRGTCPLLLYDNAAEFARMCVFVWLIANEARMQCII